MDDDKRIEYVVRYQYTKAENFVRWFMIVFLLLLLFAMPFWIWYCIVLSCIDICNIGNFQTGRVILK